MAEIDYAFLADFAKVEPNGTLTSVGASFTFVAAKVLPTSHRLAVAGRIRAKITEEQIQLRVTVSGPNDTFKLTGQAERAPGPGSKPYGDGRLGHLFALDMQIPLPALGLYSVDIQLVDGASRYLAFEVIEPPPNG